MLKGKFALVTGTTSGSGLGVANVRGEAGVSVMLNGFGAADQIEQLSAELARRTGVQDG